MFYVPDVLFGGLEAFFVTLKVLEINILQFLLLETWVWVWIWIRHKAGILTRIRIQWIWIRNTDQVLSPLWLYDVKKT